MPGIGGRNPIPFKLGGGPSDSQQAYLALKTAVGTGGSAEDGTMEAEWRMAKARGLAAMMADERAAMQAWPDTATDHIPVYEELLEQVAAPGTSDQERRDANTEAWTRVVDAATPSLLTKLQAIDSRLSIVAANRAFGRTTVHGRGFEDHSPGDPDACGPAFGNRKSTLLPNYSTDFICTVLFSIPTGPPGPGDATVIERVKALLTETLPSWVDFQIISTITGFILDQDPLDLGAFGS